MENFCIRRFSEKDKNKAKKFAKLYNGKIFRNEDEKTRELFLVDDYPDTLIVKYPKKQKKDTCSFTAILKSWIYSVSAGCLSLTRMRAISLSMTILRYQGQMLSALWNMNSTLSIFQIKKGF